jgi:hypothetical protein
MTESKGAAAQMTRRITTSATTAVGGAGPTTRRETTTEARTTKAAAAGAVWMIPRVTIMAVRGTAVAEAAAGLDDPADHDLGDDRGGNTNRGGRGRGGNDDPLGHT